MNISNYQNDLLENGYVKLPNLLDGLDRAFFAEKIIGEMEGKAFKECSNSHATLLSKLGMDQLSKDLFAIAKEIFDYSGDLNNQYHVVRHVAQGNSSEAFTTHFDSHLFTLVIPMKIPTKSKSVKNVGQLFFAPNARKMPRNEFQNIYSKAAYKKYCDSKLVKDEISNGYFKVEDFQDAMPLLFLGKTTLHGNFNVDENADSDRLSILAHFFDNGAKLGIGSVLRKLRRR